MLKDRVLKVDGAHIATLWLTFFYRFMPKLIEEGHVYISCPPLFKFEYNKKITYIQNKAELDKIVKGKSKYIVQRFKGLGEMDSEQLWETTMNPNTRTLKKICIEDMKSSEETLVMLMGSKVPPRRKFIEDHSEKMFNDN